MYGMWSVFVYRTPDADNPAGLLDCSGRMIASPASTVEYPIRRAVVPFQLTVTVVVERATAEIGGTLVNPVGYANVRPPVASWAATNMRIWPLVPQAESVLLVMLVVKAVVSVNVTSVPAVEDGQVNVGVALKVVGTITAALPDPPPPPPPAIGCQSSFSSQ
jgi:hypothetical protein